MRGELRLYLWALLLAILVAGCATPSPRFRNDSAELYMKFMGSEVPTLFPLEYADIYQTLQRGEAQLSRENIESADMYYQLAIGKLELLENAYAAEVKRREEAARLAHEKMERDAAEALRRRLELEREQAEEVARAAARAKKNEADIAEARRKSERVKHEKEVVLAATHTVKRGETLPQIAALAEVYGDSSLWPLLYRANRDQIGNPAILWPGQVLRITRNHDRSELNEARRFSSDRQLH